MLTAHGCRERRFRLLEQLVPTQPLVFADPLHLRYFANFYVDPISQTADLGGLLVLHPTGHTDLFHDARLPRSVEAAHVDERTPIGWYDGQHPARGPRGLLLRDILEGHGGRIHDSLADPDAPQLYATVAGLRRRKDPDEIEVLRTCMRAAAAGHAWALAHIRPGMTELDVYAGVAQAVYSALGRWAVVYGDFVVGSGSQRGGPPSPRVLRDGQTFILDFSVVVQGYRSDVTNTLVVGRRPNAEQQRLYDLCLDALRAGERQLRAGASCRAVYDAVHGVFAAAGLADHFPTHAGHGLGLAHPEPPFIVRHATETLLEGDVVTLEPGLYVGDIGIRVEHNYRITADGFERLSEHVLTPA